MPNDAERQSMQMAYYDEVSTTSTAIASDVAVGEVMHALRE